MKAVGVRTFGGPEMLCLLTLPIPEAGPGEVRIKVRAATVNPVDAMVRQGLAFVSDAPPPYVPGMEAAGVIDHIGDSTDTDLQVGDRVAAIAVTSGTHGAYAEYLVVPAESVIRVPAGSTDVEAATLPMNGLTARMALDLLKLPKAGTVAIIGGAGAVGGYAIQLARSEGFRIIADAAPRDVQLIKELGADLVLPRGESFAELVRENIPEGVDGLVDTAGVAASAAHAVRDGGRIVTSAPGAALPVERGIVTERTFVPHYARNHAALENLRKLAERGQIKLRVAQTFPVEEAAEAHRLLEKGSLRGRLVLTF